MSFMKRWFEEHVPYYTDEELMACGYSAVEIEWLRECFPKEEQKEQGIS